MNFIKIKNRKIGFGQPTFIIAEMSANHGRDIKKAYKIIDAAAEAGADAIKLQTYTPDTLTIKSNKKWFKIKKGPWAGKTLYDLYTTGSFPWKWQPKLKKYAEKKGLICFSTPFDESAVDFLEKIKMPAYKVSSFELLDTKLLERIGRTRKPVIVSRGMASVSEIKLAIKVLKNSGTKELAILHCVSNYPAKPEEMNLATISDIAKKFKAVAGLSDHTLSDFVPAIAVSQGAHIIEKHLTLSRLGGGQDKGFSVEPKEFKKIVKSIRETEKIIGRPNYKISKKEKESVILRPSLFVVKDIKKGEKITEKNIKSIRPAYGLPIKFFDKVIGKYANKKIEKGEPLSWDLV